MAWRTTGPLQRVAMKTRVIAPNFRHARGLAMPILIAIIVILVALAISAWLLIIRPHHAATSVAVPVASVQHAAAAASAPPPAKVAAMTTDELLDRARKAVSEQRLLAPPGNNAFEFYLKVLERDPNNKVAKDALRETFPIGANAAEQAINQNQFAEAQREIDLLAKSAPDNYTLTILRSKLDAQHKLSKRQQEQSAQEALANQQAAQNAREQAAAQKLAEQKQAAQAAEAARQAAARKTPQAGAQKAAPAKQVAKQQPAPTQQLQIQNAKLLRQPPAHYPPAAARARRQGWVDVEFTINTDGSVSDVHVVDSKPSRIFDHAATSAVARWEYQPASRNGQPMAVTKRQRINFTLGATR